MILAPVKSDDELANWLSRCTSELAPGELVDFFAFTMDELCEKAEETISRYFLESILDRVTFGCLRSHTFIETLTVSSGRIDFEALKATEKNFVTAQLQQALFCIVQDFIHVLGKLTADIITPSLIATLLEATPAAMRKKHSIRKDIP